MKHKLQSLYIDAISGRYVARADDEEGLCGFQHNQETESNVWVINHQRNFSFFLFSILVRQGTELVKVIPNKIEVLSSSVIIVEFDQVVSGVANILYYVNDKDLCEADDIDPITFVFGGINANPINANEINF